VSNLSKLTNLMISKDVDALVLSGWPNIFYFTGFPRCAGSILFLSVDGGAELLVPLLDYERALSSVRCGDIKITPFSMYEVPDVGNVVTDVITYLRGRLSKVRKLGVDLGYVNPTIYRLIKSFNSEVIDLTSDILNVRAVKDEYEIDLITNALRITEDALRRSINELRPGITEAEFAGILEMNLRFLGAEGFSFDTIVASGVNSSYPHAVIGRKTISEGEPVVIDMGATYGGYVADLTRTLYINYLPSEVLRIIDVVREVIESVEDFINPYIKVGEVDALARELLRKEGLSKYFTHSTGHGVGIEVHEHPRIAQGVNEVLKPGMVVTIEPGVYIPRAYGVRIEDMVLITKSGRKVLNSLRHVLT